MKFKMPQLHTQILIALILGALFGSVFNVDKHTLIINYQTGEGVQEKVITGWESFSFINNTDFFDTTHFYSDNQLEILAHYKKIKKTKSDYSIEVKNYFIDESEKYKSLIITNIISIDKEKTIATSLKWIGDIFIRLLAMVAIPLVFASLIVGAASLGDMKKIARIGGKTIAIYLITTAIAITIGLTLANLIEPGERMDIDTRSRLMSVYQDDASEKIEQELGIDLIQQLVEIVPRNPFHAIANGNMLQIIFFALLLGIMVSFIAKDKADPLINFFDGLSDVMIKTVTTIMVIAPVGVFALIANTVGEFGFDILQTLIWYVGVVLLGLLIQVTVTYGMLLKFFTDISFKDFYKAIRRAQAIAFSTSSSAAALPVNMECLQHNLGVSKKITSFVLPLGATINMDGTAMLQGVAAIFIAQVYGLDLNVSQQLTVILTATLASIGTAPVPGVGIIMLIIVLQSVGIPEEGIALILGVDRILDMVRTVTNITGDAAVTLVIAKSENEKLKVNLDKA